MNEKFLKPNVSEIDLDAISLECTQEQLKSMQLGYIAHSFVLKDMAREYDRFHKQNFEGTDEKDIAEAEKHALRQIRNPEYYQGETMKSIPANIAQIFQRLLMIKQKGDELQAKEAEVEIAKQNITWLKELVFSLKQKERESISSTEQNE